MASPNPGLLAALLKTGRLSGVLRWKVNLTEQNLKTEVNIANWIGYWLNLADAKSLTDCFSLISSELNLPKLNFENFVSNMTSSLQKNSAERKIIIVLSGWQEFVKSNQTQAADFANLLEEVATNLFGLVLVVDSKGDYPDMAQLSSA